MTITIVGGGNPSGPTFPVQRSVRLRASNPAYFNRTPASAGNRKTWTWSGWVKRGTLGGSQTLFANNFSSSGGLHYIQFNSDTLFMYVELSTSIKTSWQTTAVFRDPSAWYHVVVIFDTTQSVVANMGKVYVNGVLQTTTIANYSASYISQNADGWINASGYAHYIGNGLPALSGQNFDGYLTEVNFVDGQPLTPTSFGAYNSYGVWSPAKYSGTYGTNGFYLNFQDNSGATATTIGKDSSGNGNNWTPNNISVTAGVTYDSMTDVPTLTNATTANYCVINPIAYSQYSSLTDGNLALLTSVAVTGGTNGTIGVNSGKWYWEITVGATGTPSQSIVGIRNQNANVTSAGTGYPGGDSNGYGYYANTGQKYTGGTGSAYGATYTSGDVIGIAFDADAATLTFYKNNTSQGTAFTSIVMTNNSWFPAFGDGSAGFQCLLTANFGQRPFTYTPPTGFKSLNTYNLPAPTIANGAAYMAASLYTGTGAALSVANTVNGTSFQPDFVWVKGRSGATDHALYDSVRGTTKQLESNTITAETTEATGLTAFGTGGFTVGALAQMNTNTATYVGWQWKASNAAAVTNTSGSIPSTISANTASGFSVVTWTGTSANATVGHGLGIAPKMIIVFNRAGGYNIAVYNSNIGATNYLYLDLTVASAAAASLWNNTSPTSSVFSIGTSGAVNNSGVNYVAYCWAEIPGFSKFGSYTGNGSADGVFVYLGFRPRWIMVKRTDTTGDWVIWDTSRNTYNAAQNGLYPNLAVAEGNSYFIDVLSNGFKLRMSTIMNVNAGTYIYACFAENPFNYSLAR